MNLILASNSPRRKELLGAVVARFSVEPPRFPECDTGLSARDTALAFACGKAREVASRFPGCAVLGADTVVSPDGAAVLGKPADERDAARMLRMLSGRGHSVFTGVCLITPGAERSDVVETRVVFEELADEVIAAYVASGKPLDKAGAYGIQDGYPLVRRFEGSYSNVVGLPVERVRAMLREAGIV